jgi:hypothetical protein
MDQLKGSLRFIPLSAVSQFIASLGCTGRLKITQGTWSGELALRNGEVVAARLGAESGRAALDGLVLGLTEADFVLVDASVDEPADESLLPASDLPNRLVALKSEREHLGLTPGALHCVPRLVDQPGSAAEGSQITIRAGALQLIPQLMNGQSVEQIAERRGLARTLRELAMLQAGGLVRLDAAPPPPHAVTATPPPHAEAAPLPEHAVAARAPQAQAVAPAAADRPALAALETTAPRPVPPQVRPLRAVPPTHEPAARPRPAWSQSAAAVQPEASATPTIRLVPPLEADPQETLVSNRRFAVAPVHPEAVLAARQKREQTATQRGGWRGALKGFFVAD